jgi:hypothetical protein
MDQGIFVVPFAAALALIALFDARILLGIWMFLWLGMPTLRSRVGTGVTSPRSQRFSYACGTRAQKSAAS